MLLLISLAKSGLSVARVTQKASFPTESLQVTKRRGVLLSLDRPILATAGRKFYREIPQPHALPAPHGGVYTHNFSC